MQMLEAARLRLRLQVPDDLDDLWALECDPAVTRFIPDAPRTHTEAREEREWPQHGHPLPPELGLWATLHKTSGRFIVR